MTVQTLEFPAPYELLNLNQRMHWAARGRLVRQWRWAVWAQAHHELTPVARAHVVITIRFTDRRRRDIGNWAPTAKVCVDALVDAHVFPDDSDLYIVGPDLRRGEQVKAVVPWVRIDITELP